MKKLIFFLFLFVTAESHSQTTIGIITKMKRIFL